MNNLFLVEERNRLGLKAREVAEYAGIAVPTQSNYEKGKRFPDTQYLAKLADLGFDLNYVVTGCRDELHLNNEESLLLQLFRQSPEPVRKHILAGLLTNSSNQNTLNSGNTVVFGDNNHGNNAGNDINS